MLMYIWWIDPNSGRTAVGSQSFQISIVLKSNAHDLIMLLYLYVIWFYSTQFKSYEK